MNATKLLEFFGYASTHPAFDDFLIENGIKKRPKSYETQSILLDNLSLRFEGPLEVDEKYLFTPKSPGRYVFVSASFKNHVSNELPFGLKFEMNETQVQEILGKKLVAIDEEVEKRNTTTRCFYENLFIVVWMNKTKTAIDSIQFSMPTTFNFKHYDLR